MVQSLKNLDARPVDQPRSVIPSGEIPRETVAWIERSVRESIAAYPLPTRLMGQVEDFLAAGAKALTDGGNHDDLRWSYVRTDLGVQDAARYLVDVLPALTGAPVRSWWWLRKWDDRGHHLRLRIATRTDTDTAGLDELVDRGHPTTRLPYEPELVLFGGHAGLALAHDFNHLDSEFVVRWLDSGVPQQRQSAFLSEGLSLVLVDTLLSATGIDVFEKWDVWQKIKNQRDAISATHLRIEEIRPRLRKILDAADEVVDMHQPVQAELLRQQLSRLKCLGRQLSGAARDGTLERGLRQVLAPLVLFHWNRAGFSYPTQARLAAALAAELDPF